MNLEFRDYLLVGANVVVVIIGYVKLNLRVESIERNETKESAIFEEIWNRFRTLENEAARQQEINLKNTEQYGRIERKLDRIEEILRGKNN